MEFELETRMQWMDFIRGVCILLVLLLHSTTIFLRFDLNLYIGIVYFLNEMVAPFRMPLLVFLSGCLFGYSYKKGFKIFFKGKLKNILWPYFVWSILTLTIMDQFSVINLVRQIISSSTTLWFLWFIFFYYIIFYFIVKLKINISLVLLILLILSILMPDVARISRFFYLFIFFVIGHLFFFGRYFSLLNCKIIFGSLVSMLLYGVFYYYGFDIRYNAFFIYIPISFIIGLMGIKYIYKTNSVFGFIEFVGRNSIYYYATHYAILYLVTNFLLFNNFELINIFLINISVVITFGTIFSIASARKPYVRRFFSF